MIPRTEMAERTATVWWRNVSPLDRVRAFAALVALTVAHVVAPESVEGLPFTVAHEEQVADPRTQDIVPLHED